MKKTIKRLMTAVLTMAIMLVFVACTNTGKEAKIKEQTMRIISVAPSITELIYALGKGDQLVGRSDYCNYPEQASEVPSIGSLSEPNVEKILELQPDIVFASAHFKEDIAKNLEDLGIQIVVIYNAEDFNGSYDSINRVGELINAKDKSQELVVSLEKEIEAISEKVKEHEMPKVYYVVGFGKDGDYTATGDTFVARMIEVAGGENIAKDATGWKYSLEKIIEEDPEYIFISQNYGMKEAFELAEGYKALSAVKNNKVIEIDDDLLNRQGPRLAQGVESLAKILHPDLFN
ncbi:MAG TPA: ABC transporter substrate-binding protein [Epulopiscium sp.]|nr:ABC transporter substrate-binding protein [Candidatus Epulonipiscium sp.]